MRIHSIRVENFRPFSSLQEVKLGQLATIIGQNDAGKSNILQALRVFFESKPKIDQSDLHDDGRGAIGDIVIEVAFTDLPEKIELEENVTTTLQEEMLVDANGYLRIRKTYPRTNLSKYSITLITADFRDDRFSELPSVKEADLNQRCAELEIAVMRSGRGITNKSKRDDIRALARHEGIQIGERELSLMANSDLWKKLASLLPDFFLFETDTKLGVGETTFQSQFRPIVKTAAEDPDVSDAKEIFTGAIGNALQQEVDKIFNCLGRHTDAFVGLEVKPKFLWDKFVSFDILGRDQHGIEASLERRGSGMQRLLMVAFFQYMAERQNSGACVYAVEEPENCLHPKLQRELITSFRQLADEGSQIIVTSHSPVFAGGSPIDDLALVVRTAGVARAIQSPELELSVVAEELGVEPADQISGYNACIFVEGIDDIEFLKTVAAKLKEAGHIRYDFDERRVGIVFVGGDNLKHWINLRAMQRLNRRFGVLVDSDRKSQDNNIPGRKLNWKTRCEENGGIFFILRKREIENYIHPNAIRRQGFAVVPYDNFTDMKNAFGPNVCKLIRNMSADEILEMDHYKENGQEHHELKEIVEVFLSLGRD